MPKSNLIPQKYRPWIDARKLNKLSHRHIQIARELGLNPKKLSKLNNHKQQPWKSPLPIYLEDLYERRFGRRRPETVFSIEELARKEMDKREARRVLKLPRDEAGL